MFQVSKLEKRYRNFVNRGNGLDIAILNEMGYKLADRQQDLTPLQREYLIQAYPKLLELQTYGVKEFNKAFGQTAQQGESKSTKQQMIEEIKERRRRG